MRSCNSKDTSKRHILEIDFFSKDTTKYIDDVMYLVTDVLSSPESALFLRDIYNEAYNTSCDTEAEKVFGSVLIRNSECIEDFNLFKSLLDEYHRNDIGKFFKLNVKEFLSLTRYERNILIKKAGLYIKEFQEQMSSIESAGRDINNFGYEDSDLFGEI